MSVLILLSTADNRHPVGLLIVFAVSRDLDPFARQITYTYITARRFAAD